MNPLFGQDDTGDSVEDKGWQLRPVGVGWGRRNREWQMGLIARVVLLVLFGIGLVVLEVNAFSGAWTWGPSQILFVVVAVGILAVWIIRRRR